MSTPPTPSPPCPIDRGGSRDSFTPVFQENGGGGSEGGRVVSRRTNQRGPPAGTGRYASSFYRVSAILVKGLDPKTGTKRRNESDETREGSQPHNTVAGGWEMTLDPVALTAALTLTLGQQTTYNMV